MKHKGCFFEYETERNDDLLRVYREKISQAKKINLSTLLVEVVNSPSKRFWVSEERATCVVAAMLRGERIDFIKSNKMEMFKEIYRRVLALHDKYPKRSIKDLVFDVVRQPAPKFYLTPGSAKVLLCKIKKKWYQKRRITK